MGLSEDGGGSENYESTLYRVDAEPETGAVLSDRCFSPPTASSDTNAAGQRLSVDDETGEFYIDPEDLGMVFGCE